MIRRKNTMYNVLTLNSISEVGLSKLNPKKYIIGDDIKDPEGIILRSYDMHEMELPDSLAAVARAGAGTNNIPIDKCSEKGIVVFNTPGANANAVKSLFLQVFSFLQERSWKVSNGQRSSKARTTWISSLKKARDSSQAPKLWAKSSALSVLELSECLLPMRL